MQTNWNSQQLSQAECWALLAASTVGRIAYSEAAMPQIRAVPYIADGGSVVIAKGWSVHFIGKAQVLPDFEVADVAARGLTSWIDGEPTVMVRIRAEIVSGADARFRQPR
jgi:hypothetical protein